MTEDNQKVSMRHKHCSFGDGMRARLVQSFLMVFAVWLSATVSPAQGQALPSNLQVVGAITSSGTDKPTLASGNNVYAINKSSGATEGTGTIIDGTGAFFIDMSKDGSFNGTALLLRLVNGGKAYKLMEGTAEAEFDYSGGFPFPARVVKNVSVGDAISSGSNGGGSNGGSNGSSSGNGDCGGTNASFDANGDGVSNQADIDFIKTQLGSSTPATKADINKDGRVTTADVIQAMRTTAGAMRGRNSCPTKASPSCGSKKSCSEMSSCEEAKSYYSCGRTDLDADNDGIPCEDLCGKSQ